MDRIHVESGHGLRENQPRLQALLRRAYGETLEGDAAAQLCERVRPYTSRTCLGVAAQVENATGDIRELYERPFPRERTRGFCS